MEIDVGKKGNISWFYLYDEQQAYLDIPGYPEVTGWPSTTVSQRHEPFPQGANHTKLKDNMGQIIPDS